LYLTIGGIPYYLDAVRKGESVIQFINRTCFSKDGILIDEYKVLFDYLFENSSRHYNIVEVLNMKKSGLTRKEIISKTEFASGGSLTNTLNELEESGFIKNIIPYQLNKTKSFYQLKDYFIIFHLKFMKNSNKNSNWGNIVKSASWASWTGLAFERLCFDHISQIKRTLKLDVIESKVSPWSKKDNKEGAQIDLLIDRADRVVNVCEIKFYNSEFTINKEYAKKLRNKIQLFSSLSVNKNKNIFLTMITTFGVSDNEYFKELVQNEITSEDFYKE